MRSRFTLYLLLCLFPLRGLAGPGDTTVVQTFTFGSPQDAVFIFPDSTHSWERILMYYTLKCNPAQNPACGEWDYLTYTYLFHNTGGFDSTLMYQPSYMVPGPVVPDSFECMLQPSHRYEIRPQFLVSYTDTTSLSQASLGGGTYTLTVGMPGQDGTSRFLYTAAELMAAGLAPGNITGLGFRLQSAGTWLSHLRIRLAHTSLTQLDSINPGNPVLSTHYDRDLYLPQTGWQSFPFHQPFVWDGTSSLLVEIGYDELSGPLQVYGSPVPFQSTLSSTDPRHYLEIDPYHYVDAGDIDALDSTQHFTFEAWVRAEAFTSWGSLFAKKLDNEHRISIETSGSAGGATDNLFCLVGNGSNTYGSSLKTLSKGVWHHVALVYDGTGSNNAARLKLYIDGLPSSLSFTGTIPAYTPATSVPLQLSRPIANHWNGDMDEVRFWNRSLSMTEIQHRMYRGLDPTDPYWNDLILYYPLNEGSGVLAHDASGNGRHADLMLPAWKGFRGERTREFDAYALRPDLRLEQGVFSQVTDTVYAIDTLENNPVYVILFDDTLQGNVATDTLTAWPLAYAYTLNSSGQIIDSTLIPRDTVIFKENRPYYGPPFPVTERYELGRFITPYGIGLDLGEGFTWVYDVTDFAPLLRDSVHLKAGNWQELLDMKFLMIEGTPPREVHRIGRLWNGNYNLSTFAANVPPRTVALDPASSMYRVKITTTGHGFDNATNCAEFCYKIHSLDVDGTTRYSWQIMEECASNPVFPQGGTWVFDRAGWCPGAPGTLHDIEITPWVSPGTSPVIDYNCQYDPYGNYVVESYLVSYGPPSFTTDAAVLEIISPSDATRFGRENPVCGNPKVRIRNNGSANLSSLVFTYGRCGGTQQSYTWTGNLAFLEEDVVILPPVPLFGPDAALDPCFRVSVDQPNGGQDQNPHNNSAFSRFSLPPDFENPFIVRFRSNHAPQESAWWIEDVMGNILFQNGPLAANTYYDDTITLTQGCYKMMITDAGGNGLDFWYINPPYGNGTIGSARIKSVQGGYYLYSFEPDFGNFTSTAFTVGYPVGLDEPGGDMSLEVFPNPAVGQANLALSFTRPQSVEVGLYDALGREVWSRSLGEVQTRILPLPLDGVAPGSYHVRVQAGGRNLTRKLMVGQP
ncbi:MAG TPA: peptide-N-glycosidase F-related protein [Bacteroidales bacterium]|nr:peptide-N-glycosidase F-related protein [Bacteroidales bacterium]